MVVAIGFSVITALPAAIAAIASSWWAKLEEVMKTSGMLSSLRRRSRSVVASTSSLSNSGTRSGRTSWAMMASTPGVSFR